MASVMYTGTCLRPSWTAMVWPTMSGMIVERRDHVFTTRFSPVSLSRSTFTRRWSSMNGPFFRLLGIPYLPPGPTAPPPADDHLVGGLVLGPRAAFLLAPGRRRVTPAGALAFAGAGLELDVVDHRTDGDVPHRQSVARPDLGALARLQHVADGDAGGGQDVT